jgi:hypothetical protein
MPGSLSQASLGGTSPRTTVSSNLSLNIINHEVPGQLEDGGEVWVKGAPTDGNLRYKKFLRYMEEKREEARERQIEEDERKGMARRKEESWALVRVAVKFLRDNTDKWRERRIDECDRIREEDKKDRLAVSKEKKKRYGLKRLSKEENLRMTRRTDERLRLRKSYGESSEKEMKRM